MTESALRQVLLADRLRAHARWAGVLLVAAALVPYESGDGRAIGLWPLLVESGSARSAALLVPLIAGLVVAACSFASKRVETLAAIAIGSVGAASLAAWALQLGSGAEGGAARMSLAPLVIALAAAGVHHRHHPAESSLELPSRTRRAHGLLAAAMLLAIAQELVAPWFSETAVDIVARAAGSLVRKPMAAPLACWLLLAPLALCSLIGPLLGWVDVARPGSRRRPMVWVAASFATPVMLLPVATRALAGGRGGVSSLVAEASMGAVTTLLLAHAMAVLLEDAAASRSVQRTTRGFSLFHPAPRSRVAACGIAVLAASCAVGLGSAPRASRALAWELGETTPAVATFYGKTVPAWLAGDTEARGAKLREPEHRTGGRRGGAEPPPTKDEARAVVEAARALDAPLGDAFAELARAEDDGEATATRWQQLVSEVNERARRARIPYWLEAGDVIVHGARDAPRTFQLDAHRIVEVRTFRSPDGPLAALHARSPSAQAARLHALGSSRDADPYALVALDSIDAYARDIEQLGARSPGLCVRGPAPVAEDTRARCGRLLAAVLASDLVADLTATVERHELQHRLDAGRWPRARVVERRMGLDDIDTQGRHGRELSAYLAQMTVSGSGARLTLVRLLRFLVLDPAGVEGRVAALSFEALTGREPRPGATDEAFAELADLDPEALRQRAANVWQTQHGRPLPALELTVD